MPQSSRRLREWRNGLCGCLKVFLFIYLFFLHVRPRTSNNNAGNILYIASFHCYYFELVIVSIHYSNQHRYVTPNVYRNTAMPNVDRNIAITSSRQVMSIGCCGGLGWTRFRSTSILGTVAKWSGKSWFPYRRIGGTVMGGRSMPGRSMLMFCMKLMLVPWNDCVAVLEEELWSMLSRAATVNKSFLNLAGQTTPSSSYRSHTEDASHFSNCKTRWYEILTVIKTLQPRPIIEVSELRVLEYAVYWSGTALASGGGTGTNHSSQTM